MLRRFPAIIGTSYSFFISKSDKRVIEFEVSFSIMRVSFPGFHRKRNLIYSTDIYLRYDILSPLDRRAHV